MANVLIVYASRYGQTEKIAHRIAQRLEAKGQTVTLESSKRRPSTLNPSAYDAVIIGTPLYMQRFPPHLRAWTYRWRNALRGKLAALFTVSGAAASPEPDGVAAAAAIADRFANRLQLVPDQIAHFAGAIPYTRYDRLTRRFMKWIAGRSGGDTDTSRDFEYTDWDAVDRFGDHLAGQLAAEGRTEIPKPEEIRQPQQPSP